MVKSVVNQLVEIALEEQELIQILRERLDSHTKGELLALGEVDFSNFILIHTEGKPYVFMWRESKKNA
jgi:hypothetical protein